MNTLKFKETKSFIITENLPKGTMVARKGVVKDGRFFVILEKGDYSTAKIFMSVSNMSMEEIEVHSVDRMHDGDTTIYKTEEGIFYFPTPLNQNPLVVPTFNEEPIEVL